MGETAKFQSSIISPTSFDMRAFITSFFLFHFSFSFSFSLFHFSFSLFHFSFPLFHFSFPLFQFRFLFIFYFLLSSFDTVLLLSSIFDNFNRFNCLSLFVMENDFSVLGIISTESTYHENVYEIKGKRN